MSIRHLVSKNKRRYHENGYDLDLVYAGPHLITMGYPATSIEASFRNPVKHVQRLFNTAHKEKYWVFNLCSETRRRYHPSTFDYRVSYFGFEDHCPPPINLLIDAVNKAMHLYSTCPDVTLAIHCKAGKGRAGTVAICILLAMEYAKQDLVQLESDSGEILSKILDEYAKVKTYDGRAITIPSQLRYIRYFDCFFKKQLPYSHLPRINTCPKILLTDVGILNFPASIQRASEKGSELSLRIVCFSGSKTISKASILKHMELYNFKYDISPEGSVQDKLPGLDSVDKDCAAAKSVDGKNVIASDTYCQLLQELYKNGEAPLRYCTYSEALETIYNYEIPLKSVQTVPNADSGTISTPCSLPASTKDESRRSKSRTLAHRHTREQKPQADVVDIYSNAIVSLTLDAVLPLSDPVLLEDEIQIEITRRSNKQVLGSFRFNSYFLTPEYPFVTETDSNIRLVIPGTELDNINSRQLWKHTEVVLAMRLAGS